MCTVYIPAIVLYTVLYTVQVLYKYIHATVLYCTLYRYSVSISMLLYCTLYTVQVLCKYIPAAPCLLAAPSPP